MRALSRFAATSSYNAALATSVAQAVDFDGTNDYLSRASDFTGNADGKTFTFSVFCSFKNNLADSASYIYASYETQYGLMVNYSPAGNNIAINAYNAAGTKILESTTTFKCNETFFHILCSIDMSDTLKRHVYINDIAQSVSYTWYTNSSIDFTKSVHYVASTAYRGSMAHLFLDYTYRDLSIEANRRLFLTSDRKPAAGQAALNPIAYFKMDDPTTCHINSGTGGNMVLNGTVARSGRGPNQYNAAYSDLNGSSQYLSRTSALTGAVNNKQLTFACCFNTDTVALDMLMWQSPDGTNNGGFGAIVYNASGILFSCRDSSGTVIADFSIDGSYYKIGRNVHVVVSLDLSDTAKRQVYINGSPATVTWTTYTNQNINHAAPYTRVGAGASLYYFDGKLGNVYYTNSYIDLSQPVNLAKFVTGTGIDAKPVFLGANGELPTGSIPLLMLPMYGNAPGKNYGSGGDFTVNGGPFPGGRGPNEYWGNWADFGAAAGTLVKSSILTGVSDGKTISASFYTFITSQQAEFFSISSAGNPRVIFAHDASVFKLQLFNSSGAAVCAFSGSIVSTNTTHRIQLCVDLSDSSKRFVYLDGVLMSGTWATYTNSAAHLSATTVSFGNSYAYAAMQGKRGEFYITTDYIDFSLESNRLKFVDAFSNPIDLTPQISAGALSNPAIYMRFDPANQGKNYGTGGDFVKSGTINDGGQL